MSTPRTPAPTFSGVTLARGVAFQMEFVDGKVWTARYVGPGYGEDTFVMKDVDTGAPRWVCPSNVRWFARLADVA